METRLKQRFTGAIVFTALAIIILPMLLDGSEQGRSKVIAHIPDPPAIQLKKLTVGDIESKMKQMKAESAARVPHLAESPPEASTVPAAGVSASPAATAANAPLAVAAASAAPAVAAASASPAPVQTIKGGSLDKNDLPVGWSLQIASFKDQQNALKLRHDLRAASYRPYIIAAQTQQGQVYRVFIGPMVERSRLEALGKRIEASFKLKGQIVRYRIEDDAGQLGG